MFSNKKSSIMRHPYATLAIIGLAAVGAVSIGEKVKCFFTQKMTCLSSMMGNMKNEFHN